MIHRLYLDVCVYCRPLVTQAVAALIEKLGLLEATRFLALKTQGRLDSVERHRRWQVQLDKDKFFDEIFQSETVE